MLAWLEGREAPLPTIAGSDVSKEAGSASTRLLDWVEFTVVNSSEEILKCLKIFHLGGTLKPTLTSVLLNYRRGA